MEVKVTGSVIIDTEKVFDKHHRLSLEKLAWGKGENHDRMWAWNEAKDKVLVPDVKVELL